jgi:hypothetical protein
VDLTPLAQQAGDRLGDAQSVAARASRDIQSLATIQRRADTVADRAELLEGAIGTTALHASNLNNGLRSMNDGGGLSLTDGSLARGVLSWLLGRNARMVAPTAAPTPPGPVPARAA